MEATAMSGSSSCFDCSSLPSDCYYVQTYATRNSKDIHSKLQSLDFQESKHYLISGLRSHWTFIPRAFVMDQIQLILGHVLHLTSNFFT